MPAQPTWLLRVPAMIEELERLSAPFLDRTVMETLFRVRRRRAIQIMNALGGGYLIGKVFLVDRLELIAQLRIISGGGAFEREHRRKELLSTELDGIRKDRAAKEIKIPVADDIWEKSMAKLAPGIHLKPGELRIEFHGSEDLLRHLFELSQAIANDYEHFKSLVEESNRTSGSLNI